MFFVDLEPAKKNKDIFSLTSLLHTKIKVEEPHTRKDIMQCHNCQEYGHSKKYCALSPRCVRYGKNHPSSACTKSNETPANCALCNENHPANYKGCKTYKELQNHRNFSTNRNNGNKTNNVSSKFNNCESSQRPTQTTNTTSVPSYAQATSDQ
ncbi:Pre-C2HC domain,Zinc finger, CCHC-type [Cinara cedri]|uniref:Pre-C2HC domain,Zinc finger, CCHC-type n=1 Tax=Cinara cedri TaxID=506608 RepID=A0A5E4MX93_9HEMI|nr:Pre-C2HC domain,Zinc finger, CCHC-type [Cinara cedri]